MSKIVVSPETQTEAVQAGDTAKRTLEQLRAMPVTMANIELVGTILVDVKKKYNELDGRMKTITKPMREAEKSVRDLFRPALSALAEAESMLKQKIADAQRAQWAANSMAQAQAQAALAQGDVRGAALAAHTLAPITTPQGVSVIDTWDYRIVDAQAVPRVYCSPDEGLIKAAIKAGIRDIPGVIISQGQQVRVRTA